MKTTKTVGCLHPGTGPTRLSGASMSNCSLVVVSRSQERQDGVLYGVHLTF